MAPGVLSGLVCVLCLILLPLIRADYCSSFAETSGDHHEAQLCFLILGTISGAVLLGLVCVGLITCCCCPCCFLYKRCRAGRNQRPQIAINSSTAAVVSLPQQPLFPPEGYQPTYPGYWLVPAQPGYGNRPIPTAPPACTETNDPAHFPVAFPAGLPMTPFLSDAPMPYNPAYVANP